MIEELIKLANLLDERGERDEANKIDALIQKMAGSQGIKNLAPMPSSQPEEVGHDTFRRLKENPKARQAVEDLERLNAEKVKLLEELKQKEAQIEELANTVKDSFPKNYQFPKEDKELGKPELSEEEMIAKEMGSFSSLTELADKLDKVGMSAEANQIDELLKKVAEDVMKWKEEDKKSEQAKRYDSEHHHSLQIREPKKDQERVDREGRQKHHVSTYQQTNATALSTRYCPEHIGYALGRVGESTYQCSLDGKVYNWETGWTDYQGTKHPGGSVAGQTPDSSGYAVPHRIFDSRENTLNRVN